LIYQEVPILPEDHPVDILDDEPSRPHPPQNTVELSVQIIPVVTFPIPLSALRVPLAWVTSNEKIGSWKRVEVPNVSALDLRVAEIVFIRVTSRLPDVIRPNYFVAEFIEGVVRPAAAAK
jgi:hypothetical protein